MNPELPWVVLEGNSMVKVPFGLLLRTEGRPGNVFKKMLSSYFVSETVHLVRPIKHNPSDFLHMSPNFYFQSLFRKLHHAKCMRFEFTLHLF